MNRRLWIWLPASLALLAVVSCDSGAPPENSLYPGQTDFVNSEPGNEGDGRYFGGDAEGAPAAGATQDSNKASPAPPGAPQGRIGEVEEADIYRVSENRLFYLNTYRGFLIYDMVDPKSPKLLSRLPVYGYPIEMFVQGTTVYALIRDALYLTQVAGKLQFKRHNTSQLVAIDIADLKNPKVLQTVDIIGELREGVSRKIENTVYVVSYRSQSYYYDWNYGTSSQNSQPKEQAWVYSFNVSDPKNLKLIDQLKVFEGGGYSYHDPNYNTSVSRYFQGVTIAATSNALMVAENWQTYGWVSGSKYNCGSSTSQQQAIVSIVDISDPFGKIKLYTKIETYGHIDDQFKQTYFFDETTKKAYYLGITNRREWSSLGCSGSSFQQNALESWDVTDGAAPKLLSTLPFGKPNETVRGSLFDPSRSVAYAITARNVDPLYVLSYADPAQLKILSAIDGLSGDMSVFRFIGDKKQFLMGIGRDNSTTCTGFGDPATGWSTNIAVSIIDVQDLSKIRLVQRKCVAVKNADFVSSALTWNLDQAHKMIGMHSDATANVITVPVYYHTKSGTNGWWWYDYQTAIGVMSWDLSKYDPTKSELQQTVLENFGTIIHPKGEVRRTIVFTHTAPSDRRMVLNLSNTHVSLVDIQNLAAPVQQSIVEVAPFQAGLYRFGDYMVEHVSPAYYDWYGSGNQLPSEFRVKKIGGALEDQPVLASFQVGQVERVVKHKNNLVLFRRVFQQNSGNTGWYGNWKSELLVYSLASPTQPVQLGSLQLPGAILPYYWYWCGMDAFWGGYWFDNYNGNNFVTTDKGLVFLSNVYDYQTQTSSRKLMFIDLTTPKTPFLKEYVLSSSTSWSFFSLVPDTTDPNGFYLTYRTKIGQLTVDGTTFYTYKYYAQKWTVKNGAWVSDYSVNLPGRLMRVMQVNGQKLLLTYDYTYKKVSITPNYPNAKPYTTWDHSFRLNLLSENKTWGSTLAALLDYHHFQSYHLKNLVIDQSKIFVNARQDYYYQATNQIPWYELSDQLMIFDTKSLKLALAFAEPIGTYSVQLMGTFNGRLFVDLPGDGVLVVDVSNPAAPVGQQFLRTLGYSKHVEFVPDPTNPAGGTAYFAAGYFGLYQMNLLAPSSIPVL